MIAAVLLGCSNQGAKGTQGRGPAGPPPVVIVSPAAQRSIPIYGEFVGQTEAVNTVEIRSQVTGFLRRVAFVEGALVHTGDLLFVIDPRPYQAALDQAKANLAPHEAALNIARQNVARYRPLVEKHAISQQQLDTAIAQAEQEAANVEARGRRWRRRS
ncbi:MAG: biotin/lipoyl-binding protein [Nitrospirae bacterium]|nr:biotin/lipoyl-binding protein [Candidatus Manganitrophaceae bacterium]